MAKMTDERLDREFLGRQVRKVWVTWAYAQPVRKPHWLTPWEDLSENDREVDRRIGEHIADIAIATQKTRIDAQRREIKGLNHLLDLASELREAGEKKVDAQDAEIQQQAEQIRELEAVVEKWVEYQMRIKLWEDELEMSGLRDADMSIMVAATNTFREAMSLVQATAEQHRGGDAK